MEAGKNCTFSVIQYKHDSVKEGAWKGHVRVNEYHRRRNMKSLNAYKERIQKENELKRDNYR
jgi:hypothetical protein